MDDTAPNNGALFQYTRFVSNNGSQAQAPAFPNDQEVPIKQGPGAEIWETYRPTIKRLYLDEDKPLKDVMIIMQRDHRLKATVKMYKGRIKKWGLDKNCKANEMKAIARKKVERDAVGKASLFKIRGRPIEIEEVFRHFKRKSFNSLEEMLMREQLPRPETPSDVEVSTPGASIPSPSIYDAHSINLGPMSVAETEIIRNQISTEQIPRSCGRKTDTPHLGPDIVERQSLWTDNNFRRLPSLGRISPTLEPPQDLLIPERLFSAIRNCLQSSLDGDFRDTDEDGSLVSRNTVLGSGAAGKAVFNFQRYCTTAKGLLERKHFVEARQLLCRACEQCKDIVEKEHPETITSLLSIYFYFAQAGYSDAAIKVVEHLKSRAMMTPFSTRAFRQVIENFLLVKQSTDEVFSIAWTCNNDIFKERLGPFNEAWLESRLNYILRTGLPEAEILLRSLLTQCEQFCGRSDPRRYNILLGMAWNLYNQGRFQEVEDIGQDVLRWAESLKDENKNAWWKVQVLNIVSEAQSLQDKDDQAKETLDRCIETAVRYYGEQDSRVIGYSLRLEEWFLRWGRREEANALAARRARILGPAEIEELIE